MHPSQPETYTIQTYRQGQLSNPARQGRLSLPARQGQLSLPAVQQQPSKGSKEQREMTAYECTVSCCGEKTEQGKEAGQNREAASQTEESKFRTQGSVDQTITESEWKYENVNRRGSEAAYHDIAEILRNGKCQAHTVVNTVEPRINCQSCIRFK